MKYANKKLTKDTSILTLGMGLRALSQGIVFIIIARAMGPSGYGSFIALVAISTTLSHLSGLGSHVLMTRDIALDTGNFSDSWGQTLIAFLFSFPIIFIGYLVTVHTLLPGFNSWHIVILIGFADIFLGALNSFSISAYQGFGRMGRASRMILIPILLRLVGSCAFLYLSIAYTEIDLLLTWATLYFFSALLAVVYTQYLLLSDLGMPKFTSVRISTARIRESYSFSFCNISEKMYVDADKVMLARMQSVDITGVYSAAYRLIDFSLIPVQGLLRASVPKFFTIQSSKETLLYALNIIKLPFLYCLLAAITLFSLADWIVYILGKDYKNSVDIIKILALMPILLLFRYFAQQVVATSGLQESVMGIIVVGAIFNIILNLFLIIPWGWRGAVISTYLSEIIIIVLMLRLVVTGINKRTFSHV